LSLLERINTGTLPPATRVQPIHEGSQQIELFRIVVLGPIVLAGDRAEHVLGDLVRLIDDEP
jgi:hypothetical protein